MGSYRRSRVLMMRHIVLCVLVLYFGAPEALMAEVGFRDVRVAHADVDGDGVFEVVAGGRLGAPVAVDVPRLARQAGVGIYRVMGEVLHPLHERFDLHVVSDVAGGDVDGDGVDEVVVVGMGALTVFEVVNNELVMLTRVMLGANWTDRVMVADVDGDGLADVGVTRYAIDADAEIGRSEVVFLRWTGQTLREDVVWHLDGHVGDLCALSGDDGRVNVVIEVGMGDEGGRVVVQDGRLGQVLWQEQLTTGGVRALSLDARGAQLVVGGVNGQMWMARWMANRLVEQRAWQQSTVFSGLAFLPDRLILFSRQMGLQMMRY